MKQVGTYKESFDSVIETLADVLERRDLLQAELRDEPVTMEYTNKGGNTNVIVNPSVKLLNELNRDALAYWRDLGLTPKGLRAISEDIIKEAPKSKLAVVMEKSGI